MLQFSTPLTLFVEQIELLRSHVPGVLDGEATSIHDARIATRRLREVLPLMHEWQRHGADDDRPRRFKQMGRALGRVREADVHVELINALESRVPDAAAALVLVRQRQQRARLVLMRRLVKRFERVGVEHELTHLAGGAAWHRTRLWTALTGSWRVELRHLLAERASAAAEAIVHATGVYFPKRTHEARIAIKKFRYAAEVAVRTGVMPDDRLIRELKKSQDLLGDVHDRQTLIDELNDAELQRAGIDGHQLQIVVHVAEAEIADLHGRFLKRRPQMLDSVERAIRRPDRAVVSKGAFAVAGVVALAAGFEVTRRWQESLQGQPPASEPTAGVSVRVPVVVRDMQPR